MYKSEFELAILLLGFKQSMVLKTTGEAYWVRERLELIPYRYTNAVSGYKLLNMGVYVTHSIKNYKSLLEAIQECIADEQKI